jgi:hypothetical protein
VVTVPVTVNGQGPFAFLLDTGSSRSAVSSELAASLSLPTVAKTMMVTTTGSQAQPVVSFDSLTVGTASKTNLLVTVIPAPQLRVAIAGVDGIVGQDFLSSFTYTIDYRKKRLSWTAPSADDGDQRLRLVKEDGRFLVELRQLDRTLRLVPDSGATDLVIFERHGVLPLSLAQTGERARLVSMTGAQNARLPVMPWLLVGGVILENQLVVVVPRDEPDAPKGDGLLPLYLFSRVSFNSVESYLTIRQ